MKKRLLAMILALCLVIGLLPMTALAAGETYTKITTAAEFTTGTYVMVVDNGYAMGSYDNGWVLPVQPTIDGNVVTAAAGGVWTLTVDGSSVSIADSNGVTVSPKSGNTNGIQSGEYSWAWSFADGVFTFAGTGTDTTTLACNTDANNGLNRFRAYKNTTVAGDAYLTGFSLYKLDSGAVVCDHAADKHTSNTVEATCTEDGVITVTCECGYVVSSTPIAATGHNYENGTCSNCGEEEPEVIVDGALELTVDTLGIAGAAYADGTANVEGIGVEWIELGDYGNGIQMRYRTNASTLWNTTALPAKITKIELTYNSAKSTYDNADAFTFSFGDAEDNLTYTTKLSTVAGTKDYTVTTDGGDYSFFKMQLNVSKSFYWDSIVVHYEYESDTPVCDHANATTTTVEATCTQDGKTTVTCSCGYTSETVIPATGHTYEDGVCACGAIEPAMLTAAPQTGVTYKWAVAQNTLGKTLYFNGTIANSRYGGTSTIAENGVDVVLESAGEDSYYVTCTVDGAKKYVNIELVSGKSNVTITDSAVSAYTYDATFNTLVTDVDGTPYYIGCYNSFDTMSASKCSYMTEANVDVSQFPARFYIICAHDGEITYDYKDATCTTTGYWNEICDICGGAVFSSVIPALGHSYIIDGTDISCESCDLQTTLITDLAEAEDIATKAGTSYSAEDYYITGVINEISNTTYGNLYLEDADGNLIYVYGVYAPTGEKYGEMYEKPVVGDTVILAGVLGVYTKTDSTTGTTTDTPQMKDATLVRFTHEHNYVDGTCACGALAPTSAENAIAPEWNWNDDETEATATVTIPANTTYYFSDYSVNNSYVLTANGEVVADIVYGSMMTRLPTTWTVTNSTDAEVECTLKLTMKKGVWGNPADAVIGENTANVEADTQGYYLSYTADFDGTLLVEISGAENWMYVINNMTTYQYGDTQWSDSDPVVNPAEVAVSVGDVIEIMVNGYDPNNPWTAPAANLTVKLMKKIPLMSMNLANSLEAKFAFPQAWITGEGYKVVISQEGKQDQVIEQANWGSANANGVASYIVSYTGLAAKEMIDELTVTLYDASGAIVAMTRRSVVDYAIDAFNGASAKGNHTVDEAKALYVDLLAYGAAAQVQLNYKTDDLATYHLTGEMEEYMHKNNIDLSNKIAASGDAKLASCVLESNISLRMAFDAKYLSGYTFTYSFTDHNGKIVSATVVPVSTVANKVTYAMVTVDALVVADCKIPVTVTITDANGAVVATGTDAVGNWATRTSNTDLAMAMMQFSTSAFNYLH